MQCVRGFNFLNLYLFVFHNNGRSRHSTQMFSVCRGLSTSSWISVSHTNVRGLDRTLYLMGISTVHFLQSLTDSVVELNLFLTRYVNTVLLIITVPLILFLSSLLLLVFVCIFLRIIFFKGKLFFYSFRIGTWTTVIWQWSWRGRIIDRDNSRQFLYGTPWRTSWTHRRRDW